MAGRKKLQQKCTSCGYLNQSGVNFCEQCGSQLGVQRHGAVQTPRTFVCPNCGTSNEVGSRFCVNCGAAFSGSKQQVAPVHFTQAASQPPIIVLPSQDQPGKRNWWPLAFLLLLLLFGCALWTSLIEVSSALASGLPDFLQGPAAALHEWQENAEPPAAIQDIADWAKDVRDGVVTAMQGGAAASQAAANDDGQIGDGQAGCPEDLDNISLNDNTYTDLASSKGSIGPPIIVYKHMPNIHFGTFDEWETSRDPAVLDPEAVFIWASFYLRGTAILSDCEYGTGGLLGCDVPDEVNDWDEISEISLTIVTDEVCLSLGTHVGELREEQNGQQASQQTGQQGGVENASGYNGPPMLSVSQATMCRKGPGSNYQAIGDLQVGESTEIVAQYMGGDWWVVENYRASGTCWLYGGYAQISGDTSGLPYWEAPAPPVVEEVAPEPSVAEENEQPETITFTFLNNLELSSVCSLWIRPAGGSWGSNLISSCIGSGGMRILTIANGGSVYDLKGEACYEGCAEFIETGVIISEGSAYPFKPN